MADFRWDDFHGEPLVNRFHQTNWCYGIDEWEAGMQQFPFGGLAEPAREWVREIRRVKDHVPPLSCPRVFISHRQIDERYARCIAHLAATHRFNYWLDVIDLDSARNLQVRQIETMLQRPLTDFERGILTGAIIEMALLNCTHVLAVMTGNTAGSQWVPYEYGRVKEPLPASVEASCWWDTTSLPLGNFPEYMWLGMIHFKASDITAWFDAERRRYQPTCHAQPGDFEDIGDYADLP